VDCVRVPVGDAADCVSDGAEERDKEGGDGSFRVVLEAKAAALDGMVGKQVGESRDVRLDVCSGFEEQCGGVMEGGREVRAPVCEGRGGAGVSLGVVEDIGE
jgi:hypothetical protein